MNLADIISAILTLLTGIGIFLISFEMISSNLESANSKHLKNLFKKASRSKFLGIIIGTVGTVAINSSGATTVMTIGFVNAGIISLVQAATIIYGANIGTTISAQIVALGMGGGMGISGTVIFASLTGIGAFIALFSKKKNIKTIGAIIAGFGMLFVGLGMMGGAMTDFSKLDSLRDFLKTITNPLLLVLIGAVLTAIIQSSTVVITIAITMVYGGLIALDQGIYLTMGSNIGSCVVALIAGLTSGLNAKRTSLIHLFFNCFGVLVFLLVGVSLDTFTAGSITFGTILQHIPSEPQVQLALFHLIFNVATVMIIFPLTDVLVNTVCKIVPETDKDKSESSPYRLYYIDQNLLKTPPIAVEQTKREILNMGEIAMANFERALDIITKLDFSEEETFHKAEEELNYLNKALYKFVILLLEQPGLNEHDHVYLSSSFRTIRDLERIGDYAENMVEYAETLKEAKEKFSDDALYEISQMRCLIRDLYKKIVEAYRHENLTALQEANVIEDLIDDYTKTMEDSHIKRLSEGICTPTTGAQYLSLASNAERIADHLINVGKSIRDLESAKAKPIPEN